ncbi:glycosyltransferase [Leptolyngbya sp. FACHB-17]|uniref:glycosyltransferase n=1 Tax=unclassified Leptolyngbya TaxID=2650499 RepID=UPI0016804C67|nr:glycosyltransferase [Leptolyngbya sp. FACHB-17]MBD2081287.1 glycosyltransferase [Leptolyngbya sp. FACHB-17]
MATAILDLDLNHIPSTIAVSEHYSKALILIRLNGRPIGQTTLPVVAGQISGVNLREQLICAAGERYWQQWLHDYLNWNTSRETGKLPTATVAVCTRDRPDDLRRCLDGLMQLPDDGQEFLVIDNCSSTDATQQLVQNYQRIRYIREERPGLDIARNRALREAKHEVVAFTDDDAVPDPNWLRALLPNFNDPLVLCVTGLTMPLELETEAQEWFEQHCPFGKGFWRKSFDLTKQNPLAVGCIGAGANMAIRRSSLERVGAFDEVLDAGTKTCSGGDHEMFARILTAGYRIIYDPTALSWHRHRRTWEALRQTFYGYGVGVYASFTRHLLAGELSVLQLALGWFWRDQLPNLRKALLQQSGSVPLDLVLAELQGCLVGPWAYLSARRQLITHRQTL